MDQVAGLLKNASNKRVLVLCPIGIGNFIMATPTFALLSQHIGPDNLEILALRPAIGRLAKASGYFGHIHNLNADEATKKEVLQSIASLRRRNLGFVIGLFPTADWRYSLYAYLSGARIRVGFDYRKSTMAARAYTHKVALDESAHDTDQNYALASVLVATAAANDKAVMFPIAPSVTEKDNLAGVRYYVCHPGSSVERGMKEKRLPVDRFVSIIERIDREFGLKCVLIGGPEELSLRQEIAAAAGDHCVPCETDSFADLARVISDSLFYLGNDSGLMHISVALGKQCVAFFGPTDHKRNGPYSGPINSPMNHLVVRSGLQCSPCWTLKTVGANPACIYGDTRCLTQFDLDAAWPNIHEFIGTVVHNDKK